jgi:hypothetical protein
MEFVQVPVVFAVLDAEGVYKTFEVDETTELHSMQHSMRAFVAHLRDRRAALRKRKRLILNPIYRVLDRVAQRHRAYFDEHAAQARAECEAFEAARHEAESAAAALDGRRRRRRRRVGGGRRPPPGGAAAAAAAAPESPSAAAAASNADTASRVFDATLWGKFRKHLDALCDRMIVFSFNGSGYDHVLLLSRLVCFANSRHEPNTRIRVIRAGNRIRSITMGGIRFSDAMHLLSAGSSLRGLAQMTGLASAEREKGELTKGHFPFRALTSHAFLRQRELPTDPESWYNELRGEYTPEETIRACVEDFKARQFPDVMAYLLHYLKSKLEKK